MFTYSACTIPIVLLSTTDADSKGEHFPILHIVALMFFYPTEVLIISVFYDTFQACAVLVS